MKMNLWIWMDEYMCLLEMI